MPSVYTVSREQFEHRMRVRRAATCLAVARSAVASGKLVEAIDRLEEACALDPDAAEARLLLEELRSHETTAEVAAAKTRPRTQMAGASHWVAAAIAICALAALAFFWPTGPSSTDGSAEPSREAPSQSAPPPPAATGQAPEAGLAAQLRGAGAWPAESGPPPVGTGGAGLPDRGDASSRRAGDDSVGIRVTEQPVVQRSLPIVPSGEQAAGVTGTTRGGTDPVRESQSAGAATTPQPVPGAEPGVTAGGTPAPVARPSAPPPQLPPLERVPIVDDPPVKVVSPPDAEASPTPAMQRTADVPAEASLRSGGTETGQIEGTLRRYVDAYGRLDAAAAHAVWPTVDQRALARAFENLESQGIVFEHCDVAVAGDDATAACSGRARYVPKVGSREPLVERRHWNFRLRKADAAGWQITHADAR